MISDHQPPPSPTYLVDPASDPVLIRIQGRASFQNTGSLTDFFASMFSQKRSRFVMDFRDCTTIDSTFLGVLAGVAIDLRKQTPPGTLVVTRLSERNLELIHNLGLHCLLIVDEQAPCPCSENTPLALPPEKQKTALESARIALAAHETLVDFNPANLPKFQDVLTYLKSSINTPQQ